MCVTITLSPVAKHSRLDPNELAGRTGLLVRRRAGGAYELCPSDGCGCDFVGNGKSTDADWSVRMDHKVALAAAVTLAARRFRRFRFTASWMNDPVMSETSVTLSDMLAIIDSGKIGRRSFQVTAG